MAMSSLLRAAALGAVTGLLGCAGSGVADSIGAEEPAARAGPSGGGHSEELLDALDAHLAAAHGVDKARRSLAQAEHERSAAEAAVDEKVRKAREELRAAEVAVEVADVAADTARAKFETRRSRLHLSVQRAEHRVQSERADLAGIRAIYAEDMEATAAEEIIRRNEANLAFAESELDLALRELETLESHESGVVLREVEEKQHAAHSRLLGARAALEALEREIVAEQAKLAGALEDARFEVDAAERKAERAGRKYERVKAETED